MCPNSNSLSNLKLGPSHGGKAVRSKFAPEVCTRCGMRRRWKTWHGYLAHRRICKLAAEHGWSYERASLAVSRNGLSAIDPAPWNGAWRKIE